MVQEDEKVLRELQDFLRKLSVDFDPEIVVIGGWAVHAYGAKDYSLDGDIMLSYVAEGALRDMFEITRNPRMAKEQFRSPIPPMYPDIALYVERQHGLRIPFDEIQAHSRVIQGMRVACPEHLIILKFDAAQHRKGSGKGTKDCEDLANLIGKCAHDFRNPEILMRYMSKDAWDVLRVLATNQEALERITNGNLWQARRLRESIASQLDEWILMEKQNSE